MTTSRLRSTIRGTVAIVIVTALVACGSDSGSTDPALEDAGATTETTSPPQPVEVDVDAPGEGEITDAAAGDPEVDPEVAESTGDDGTGEAGPDSTHVPGDQDTPADVDEMAGGPGSAAVVIGGEVRRMDVACTRFSSWFVADAEERGGAEWRFVGSFWIDDPDDSTIQVLPPLAGAGREAGSRAGELHDVVVGDGVASGSATATFPEGDGGLDVVFELECPPDDAELPVSLQDPDHVDPVATVTLGDETVVFSSGIPDLCSLRVDGRGFNILSLPSPDADLSLGVQLVRRGGEDSVGLSVFENETGNVLLPDALLWAADSTRWGTIAALEVSDDGRTVSGAGEFESPEGGTIPMTFEVTCG